MIHGGESEPRNSNLMKMFNLIGYGERAGSGVPDIFAVWQDAGYREPTVEEQFGNGQPNRMIVTLPLVGKEPVFSEKSQAKSQAKKAVEIKERTRAIIELIQGNPEITTPGIAAALGITERKIRTVIDHMKENHWVHFERSGSGGKWVIDRLPE